MSRKFSLVKFLIYFFTAITVLSGSLILLYIIVRGIPNLNFGLFALDYNLENLSMMPALINTLFMIGAVLLISLPLGIFSAIYLVEYNSKDNFFIRMIRISTQTLTGIPSIVYGLFGFMFFILRFEGSYSFLAGVLTLSIMVLPTIIRTTEEALLAVPRSLREGSLALGADEFSTIYKVVLPAARSGVISGIILSIGKIVGETAALIFTAGTTSGIVKSLMDPGRTMAVHMYALISERLYLDQASAVAFVLIIIVLIINSFSKFIINRSDYEV